MPNDPSLQRSAQPSAKRSRLAAPVIGALIGGLAGFAYYYFWGCDSG